MVAVPGHGHPIGVLYRHHSLNRDITGSVKYPPEKQTRSHWPVETLHRQFLSVAMILCNKMGFSFGTNMADFCRDGHIFIYFICIACLCTCICTGSNGLCW